MVAAACVGSSRVGDHLVSLSRSLKVSRMIPKTILREHVLEALRQIDRNGVPVHRLSTKFSLAHGGKDYPPKYVISLAHRFAAGRELDSASFSGGEESNSFLRALGFEIAGPIERQQSAAARSHRARSRHAARDASPSAHNERCGACKATVQKLLEKLYGKVVANPPFDLATKPDALKHECYGSALATIYQSLQEHRGFQEFVKSATLPRSDWFVPRPVSSSSLMSRSTLRSAGRLHLSDILPTCRSVTIGSRGLSGAGKSGLRTMIRHTGMNSEPGMTPCEILAAVPGPQADGASVRRREALVRP
jgi:hypothetical protein